MVFQMLSQTCHNSQSSSIGVTAVARGFGASADVFGFAVTFSAVFFGVWRFSVLLVGVVNRRNQR